ncbi:hypothetical protein B0T11DRAFT_319074 [Plectosphaerella cucumerina]|uniref:Uncharacterized protein n=1 Tax=Plectosphaerella cucumerina TaxID=40658 RepID=A0A8K0TA59_9PEZI|nr:hypothetical protein B0T11DRAFT_319074 [Plectosphaerella cucumerina]
MADDGIFELPSTKPFQSASPDLEDSVVRRADQCVVKNPPARGKLPHLTPDSCGACNTGISKPGPTFGVYFRRDVGKVSLRRILRVTLAVLLAAGDATLCLVDLGGVLAYVLQLLPVPAVVQPDVALNNGRGAWVAAGLSDDLDDLLDLVGMQDFRHLGRLGSRAATVLEVSTVDASPRASRFTTDCYTTRCTERVACNAVATTTNTRTTSGCPSLPEYQPWYNGNEDAIPTPGDPGWGGFVAATGTYVDPALITPPTDPEEPPAEPEKSVPVPPDGRRPFFAVAYWEEGDKGQYHGFDVYGGPNLNLAWSDMCEFEKVGAVWKYPGDPMIPPGTIRDIPVHKDLCTYTNAKGMTCNKWKDLMCQS